MPHLKVMGLDKKHVSIFSNDVVIEMAKIAKCPEQAIKVWFINGLVIESQSQENSQTKLFIEIAWKKRSDLITQKMAQYINSLFKSQLNMSTYVTFTNIENTYYVEGVNK